MHNSLHCTLIIYMYIYIHIHTYTVLIQGYGTAYSRCGLSKPNSVKLYPASDGSKGPMVPRSYVLLGPWTHGGVQHVRPYSNGGSSMQPFNRGDLIKTFMINR